MIVLLVLKGTRRNSEPLHLRDLTVEQPRLTNTLYMIIISLFSLVYLDTGESKFIPGTPLGLSIVIPRYNNA